MAAKKLSAFKNRIKNGLWNNSIILKYFAALLVLEFLGFIVLGISFSLLGRNDWSAQKLELMENNTKSVAELTTQVLEKRMNTDKKVSKHV